MSRCFPFPPPGLLRNGARGEVVDVSESIKIQRDWGKAITRHDKKKRKEKKERKEDKKENGEALYTEGTCHHLEKIQHPNGKEEEVERSSLTEEHDQPVCTQSISYSSDSTWSSNKRKRDDSEYNGTKSRNLRLRIRLPFQKHKEADASVNGDQLCSTSGRSDSLIQQKGTIQMPVEKQCSAINPNNCRTDLKWQEKSTGLVKTASGMLSHRKGKGKGKGKGMHTAESPYKFLIEDWVPPALEFDQTNCDDEDWLFRTKKQVHASKSLRSQRDGPCLESSALWPSALYLPQVDVYALPYTVPF